MLGYGMAKRILTVDDSRSLRQMLVVTLRSAGYDVTEAEHGAEALDIAKRQTFDLVLTDINMPVMGGIELVKNLRLLPNYKFVPILCLTT